MKNLFERLSQEKKDQLEVVSINYPAIAFIVTEELKRQFFWSDVTFELVMNFKSFLDVEYDDFYKCFNQE